MVKKSITNANALTSYYNKVMARVVFQIKVHIEGRKILWNRHRTFDWHYIGQIYGGDFTKFRGLLRIYALYDMKPTLNSKVCDLLTTYANYT